MLCQNSHLLGDIRFKFYNKASYFDNYKYLIGLTEKVPKDFEMYISETVKGEAILEHNVEFCEDFLNKYVSYVTIEAKDDEILKSQKERRVSFTDQLATVGGTLGLFSGISIISMIEVVCLFLKITEKSCKGLGIN